MSSTDYSRFISSVTNSFFIPLMEVTEIELERLVLQIRGQQLLLLKIENVELSG